MFRNISQIFYPACNLHIHFQIVSNIIVADETMKLDETCAGNWFADHNEWPNRIQLFVAFFFFWTRRYNIVGQKLSRSNKFIICVAYFVLLEYT